MESGIEGLELNEKPNVQKSNAGLETLFGALAGISLFICFIAALGYGWTDIGYGGTIEYFEFGEDFNAGPFFFYLLGGVASFAVFRAFALFVKAANKYLNR